MKKKKFLRVLTGAMAAVMLVSSAVPAEAAVTPEKYRGGGIGAEWFQRNQR
ncbi:MAG: hypothetical protein K2P76_13025 [Lachnospiraceae bacterium]|nr:hypothetical protein [Lachnospiraceae bacterium]